jgi:hypothetical protein
MVFRGRNLKIVSRISPGTDHRLAEAVEWLMGPGQCPPPTAASGERGRHTVNDATGSGAGWHVTTAATTFTNVTNGTHTLPDTGTFVTNGTTTSISATAGPTATCAAGTTCTPPTNLITSYPLAVTTATAPAVNIYDNASGNGQVVIGGSTSANPVGWWVNVPASAFADAYISTVTMAVISTP